MKLSGASLARYTGPARLTRYDRAQITPGIVHLGIGAFHRAHQAIYVDDALEQDSSWGIRAFSLRSPDMRDALMPQDCLYILAERGAEGVSSRVIGSVLSVDVGAAAAQSAIADPTTRLVTLTVTEKGYTPELATLIVAALAQRAETGAGPLTILSCDNLSANGKATEALVRPAIQSRSVEDYVVRSVRFPSCMVDRITPAITEDDRSELTALTGLEDAWPVITEPFSQWVIEDNFAGERPPLIGVEWVLDVAPYEDAKLRLLNGAHTTLALLGPMLGHRLVSDAVGDPVLRGLIDQTARNEVIPHLALPAATLLPYWNALLERFANPALQHTLAQIACDTSKKVPQRLVAPLQAASAAGRDTPGLALALAAWVEHISRETNAGRLLQDPLANELSALAGRPVEEVLARLQAPNGIFNGLSRTDTASVVAAHILLDGAPEDILRKRLTSILGSGHA